MSTVYYTATSIDGYIADRANSLDWLLEVPGSTAAYDEAVPPFLAGVGAMAMGATTYEWILRNDGADSWDDHYGSIPCWVFTHRPLPTVPGADIRFVQGDVAPVHEAMVRAAGDRTVWLVGGGALVGAFIDDDLVDEIRLGAGAPLLPRRLTSSRLRLVDVSVSGQFVRLTYGIGRGVERS